TTFNYLKGRKFAPTGEQWELKKKEWETLFSDDDAAFDEVLSIDASAIQPMITYGTNPGLGIAINARIPVADTIPDEG
ncbi:aconitase family protein, partial [Klebsiella pneumoniae]|uniref:aconitase family protein n=1 Tax=Klebsiella pneumoniae TaxID=573 RepID=UPI003CEF34FD